MRFLIYFLFLISFTTFSQKISYKKEIDAFREIRIDSLKNENGWLNLAGIFWLKEGENTIGSDQKNDFVFPAEHSDSFLGKIILEKGIVTFKSNVANQVFLSGRSLKEMIIYQDKKVLVLEHKSLRWFVIKRGDQYALRLRDVDGEYVRKFKEITYFPLDSLWRIKAKFIPTHGKKLHIIDITGRTFLEDSPGEVHFTRGGNNFILQAGGTLEELFIVFGDLTNQKSSYGGGRFLYANGPDNNGYVVLDFNKSLNPPCAFTPFATCPLPTKENKIKLEVDAGEKSTGFLTY